MKEEFSKLLDAQDIDLEIDQLVRAKKDYPEEISTLQKEIDDLKREIDETGERIDENRKNRLLIEDELEAEHDMLSKKEKRLLETKSNKEYNAVQAEIEQARARIDNLETEDIQLMTENDELTPKLEDLNTGYKKTKTDNTATIKDIQKKFDSIESDIAEREKRRDAALSDVNKRVLSVYTRLRKGKSGLAVAHVDHVKFSCKGCHKQLPPQKVLEVRRSNKLIFCENCGRILVWDPRGEME